MELKSKQEFCTPYTYNWKCVLDGETFTEPSLTDTSPSSFEPIDVKVARILRGEIIPSSDIYYEVDDNDTLEDAFDKMDPTEDTLFDLADVTDITNDISDKILRDGQNKNQHEQQGSNAGQGQANEGSANESDMAKEA